LPQRYTPWPVLQNVRYDAGSDARTVPSRVFPSHQRSFCAVSFYRYQVSGTLHLPFWGTFQLSVTLLFRYRSQVVFSFGGWCPPASRTISNARYSGTCSGLLVLHLRDCHTLWSAVSCKFGLANRRKEQPYNTTFPRKGIRFELCRFHSPLLTASRLISFPAPTEMFQFGAFPIITDHK
jgi:hypothetical protein